jgi:hypothetical protein
VDSSDQTGAGMMNSKRESESTFLSKLSDTSFIAMQGDDQFLLQFGKLGLTLNRQEMRLLADMMGKTKTALENDSHPDPVLAWVGIGEVQQSADGFFLVRVFNCYLCSCKKMLLALVELCVEANASLERDASVANMPKIDADIVATLAEIEKSG